MLKDRKCEEEFHTLYPHLIDDESKFFKYFRMHMGTLEKILLKTEDDLKKKNTPYRLNYDWSGAGPLLVHTSCNGSVSLHSKYLLNVSQPEQEWSKSVQLLPV